MPDQLLIKDSRTNKELSKLPISDRLKSKMMISV
jgi:hypothetical protein